MRSTEYIYHFSPIPLTTTIKYSADRYQGYEIDSFRQVTFRHTAMSEDENGAKVNANNLYPK